MKRLCLLSLVILLSGCQSVDKTTLKAASSESSIYKDTSAFTFDGYKSHAWVSDKFTGRHSRQIKDDAVHFTVYQSHENGGLDVGLSKPGIKPAPVAAVLPQSSVCSSYDIDLSGDGRWWAGPKISVNWQGIESAKGNGDDWYENYVVEIASTSPDELHDILTDDYFSPEILPDTVWAGATYRNYKIRFHDWWQFWSVRQDYRKTGTLPVKPVLSFWAEHGLPTQRKFDGVKANIETYGQIRGTGRLAVNVTTRADAALDCAL